MNSSASPVIDQLGLQAHPEGGWYRETFRSPCMVTLADGRVRSAGTSILFLLEAGDFSAFHRVSSDEIWHFHSGKPLELVMIDPFGNLHSVTLGADLSSGEKPHHAVPAGWWQAAAPLGPEGYSLVGCTVSPGFDFADFEMPSREELLAMFPSCRTEVIRFSRNGEGR